MEQDRQVRLPDKMRLRVPRGLPAAVQIAASRELTSPSEFARRALLAACRSAGVELRADGRVEAQGSAA